MPYLDGTERSLIVPKWCPLCRGKLATKWVGVVQHKRRGYVPIAFPVHACPACDVSVQVQVRRGSLQPTRAAARRSIKKKIEAKQQAASAYFARRTL